MAPVGSATAAEELEALRQQVRQLLAQNSTLQADLSRLQGERTAGEADAGEVPRRQEAGDLQRAVSAALQPEQDVEVLRLEVVRRRGSSGDGAAASAPVDSSGGCGPAAPSPAPSAAPVAIEGRAEAKRPLAWCCQANPCREPPQLGPATPSSLLDASPFTEPELEEKGLRQESLAFGPVARARRTADTMLLGGRLHFSVRSLQRELEATPGLDEEDVQERWNELHRRNAAMVVDHIMRYRGFFIKMGQRFSTMKGALPDVWVEALEPLQDHVPVTPLSDVQRTLCEDLGCNFDQVFSKFEATPIGSASIGQAHVAWLRETGEKVCVKVEHPGVAELTGTDLANIEYLVKMMAQFHEEAPDLTETIKEMRRASLDEVDFRLEARNAMDARAALLRAGSAVGCPEPLVKYCGHRVLTMRFIEGWKVTETERLPPGTDRETLAARIVEAFALLVFEEGLVHGDPHPGNIFVEKVGEGPQGYRPVLLDWGMVKRVSAEERVALAKWVVASLSRDRFLYLATIVEMGVNISGAADLEALDMFMFTGMLALRDSIPANGFRQFREQFQKQAEMDKEKKKTKMEAEGKKVQKLVEKIPGWVHFFFKGLGLLQDICGMLDVTVPVARIMLKYAMPHLESSAGPAPTLQGTGCSAMECAVQEKLEELVGRNAILGVQVAVLLGGRGEPGRWACDVATGRRGPGAPAVSSATLMPLLDVGEAVLVACLLATLSRPTVTGKEVGLDTPVERLWPEFSRSGKAGVTVRQLLQRHAGLAKPFRAKTSHKTFCNEMQMEESVAACSRDAGCPIDACHVLGVAAAALLRRATGHKSAGAALRAVLEPLGLQEDIAYCGNVERMASAGHKILEEVSMASIWEILEEQMQRQQREVEEGKKKAQQWLSWQELALEQPWCTDPLLVNSEDLRLGRGCSTSRGLRATARALCQLLAADALPQAALDQSLAQPQRLRAASLEEWEDLGRCLDVGAGWQLLKFTQQADGAEVLGFGRIDGTTGSAALRLPGASVSVLLSCVDKEARQAGHELLTVIASHLGLSPAWHLDPPKGVPEKGNVGEALFFGLGAASPNSEAASPGSSVEQAVLRLEAQVSRLAEALGAQASVARAGESSPGGVGSDLAGCWASAEVEGLEEILDALNVPAMARAFAKRMRRTLRLEVAGDHLTVATTTTVAGRQLEDTVTSFRVGEAFETQQMGNACRGLARWDGGSAGPEARALVVEKRFEVMGNEICLEERLEPAAEGRLAMRSVVRGKGEVSVSLESASDLDLFRRNLDAKSLRLKAEVQLGSAKLWRGGRLVGADSVEALGSLSLPTTVVLRYDDLRSTTMFDPEGGQRPRREPAAASPGNGGGGQPGTPAASGEGGVRARTPPPGRPQAAGRRRYPGPRGCVRALAAGLLRLGRALEGACEEKGSGARRPPALPQQLEPRLPPPNPQPPQRRPSAQLAPEAGEEDSLEGPTPFAESIHGALRLARQLSGQSWEEEA